MKPFLSTNALGLACAMILAVTSVYQSRAQISDTALYFNGDNYVEIQNSTDGTFDIGSGPFTTEAWIRVDSVPDLYEQTIISNNNYYADAGGFRLTVYPTGELVIQYGLGSAAILEEVNVSDGTCHHVAVIRNSGGFMQFVVDGELYNSTSSTESITSTLPLLIGMGYDGGNENQLFTPFYGAIKEIRFWNTARTLQQIQANVDNALSPQTGLIGYWRMNEGSGTLINDYSMSNKDGFALESLWATGCAPSGGNYVTIPDPNFVTWLQNNGYAACMNGNLMDTTCPAVVNAYSIDCSGNNISDLTGIQYFDNLYELACGYNNLTELPQLPQTLGYLSCIHNQLLGLPLIHLQPNLTWLDCSHNQISSFNVLPAQLTYFDCSYNNIHFLPELPNALLHLDASHNPELTCLPDLNNVSTLVFVGTAVACIPYPHNVTNAFPPVAGFEPCGTFSVSSVSNGAGSFTLTTNYTPTAVDPEWPSPVFYWSTGETAGQIATAAGFYSVTVSPISGCEETASIIAGSQFQIQLDDVYVPWCDWNNTFIAPTIDGGEAPYTYLWNTGDTDEQIDNTQPGIYSVTVTDANGLTASDDAVVTTDAIAMIPSPLEINCDSGVINATVTVLEGGMAPYSFLWSNGDADGHTIFEHGTLYNLTITDANGCSIEYTDMFFGYAVVVDSVINATCGLPDGAAYIGIEEFNSIGDFQYAWSNGSTSEDLTGVPEGIYNVTVTDFMGCTVDETVEVNCNGTSLQLNMIVTNDPCSAQSGSIEVTVTGGTPPYTFTWSNGSTDASLFNITAGAYELTVTDVVGSTVSGSALVFASDPPSLTIATTDATCISGGLVDLTVSGGLAPYSFIWSNGATTEDLLDASPGDYTVTVSTIDGCEAIGSAEILPPGLITPPTVVVTYSPVIACVNLPATLEVTEIYQSYEWSTGETTASIQTFNAGYHFVTVTDASGCTAVTEAIIISYLPPLPVNIIAPVPGCGATSVTLSTDMTAQSYVWSTGETTPTITVTANGTYGVTIVDLAGCELWDEVIVTFIPPVSVWINPINPGCGATNGAINLTVSGGTAPFSFIWSTGETSEDLSGVPSGTYNVTVTDANGCTAFESVVLADATVCGAPTNPTAAVNNTTAVIQWDAQPCAVKYRVLVKQMGAAGGPWVMHFVNAPNVTLTLTGLTPGKMYKYRVRAVCSPTGSVLSPWSVTNTFTAAGNVSACVPPASITATNPTPNGAIVNWTSVAGSYGYQLRYRVQGSVSWTPVVINNGAAGSQTLTGLQSNTTYEFQMRTKCAVGPVTWSTYSPIQSFATALRLSEAEAVRVSVYPNPANGLVDITLNESLNATIELISVEGKLLQRIETIANATIDVSDVANGLYLLRIITQNGERHERIVVQH